jgi:hypothetical protein
MPMMGGGAAAPDDGLDEESARELKKTFDLYDVDR